ncbi:MAG: hypothetical protein EP330_17580 [Deltaproteobacteria bacterium]|nr:MAG: hypothetical protein EP330_17580 [Deltaproteobacteria bacterium]
MSEPTECSFAASELSAASECLVCGASAAHRVELVAADGVPHAESSLPLCEAHHQEEAARWVRVTLVGGSTKLLPVVAAWGAARWIDAPQAAVIALAVVIGGVLAGGEWWAMARLHPRARLVGREGQALRLEVDGKPPPALTAGGPPPRRVRSLLDRTRPRAAVSLLVVAAAALVAGWQWSQRRPTLWVHNPAEGPASVTLQGQTHTLAPGESLALSPGVGRHQVTVIAPSQRMELPIDLQPASPMLLATEPSCYAIGVPMATTMQAEGQLFTLGTGEWRPVTCGE